MKEDRIFYYALIASLVVHIGFLVKISHASRALLRKSLDKTEIVYQKFKVDVDNDMQIEKIKRRKKPDLEKEEKILLNKKTMADQLKDNLLEVADILKISKRRMTRVDANVKHKISIPVFQSEKGSNPKYSNYHQTIRRKIKERAYFYVDNLDFETGEVYLTFVLLADGTLKKVQIMESKTSANAYLRGVGLRSIKESSPFPPFPKDLSYPELSFNVVISFEVQE